MYTHLVSSVLFPLQEMLKRHRTVAIRRSMEHSQWWTADQIRELQVQRLRAFLAEAGTHVPYYRDMFRTHGFLPDRVQGLEALRQLPFLTKAVIREHRDAMKSQKATRLARFNTGGSSGEPLIFFIGQRVDNDVAAKWRATRWWGVDIGDPEIVVWGSPIELKAQDRLRGLRDALMRTELLPAFEMNPARLDAFVAAIRARRPRMLFGYPSALAHIGRHAATRGIRMDDLGIRVAFVTAEKLYPDQEETIRSVFGCPVANGYGARDAGFVAHQCPAGGMHITAEDIVVEIVDGAGAPVPVGEAGEIVVTHLATPDFPFIRYRTGDIAIMDDKPCSCGRGLPMLREVQGRSTDFVRAQDGTVMHGLALVYTLRDIEGIESFKIVQESLQLTRVDFVPGNGCNVAAATLRIQQDFRARLGGDVDIQVTAVEGIAPEASGKFRYVQSKVTG